MLGADAWKPTRGTGMGLGGMKNAVINVIGVHPVQAENLCGLRGGDF